MENTQIHPSAEKWHPLMEEWRKSGLSVKEWTDQHDDITYKQFMDARRKYFPEDLKKNEFVENETEWSTLSVELSSSSLDLFIQDCRIEISSGFDQELLLEVLEVLRREN